MNNVIELVDAGRTYKQGSVETRALQPTSLSISKGELLAVVGRSGSGKSTFLNLITGIDRSTCGRVIVDGVDLSTLSESQLAAFRGARIGIVFQFFELIPTLTVLENVVLAMDLVGTIPIGNRRVRAMTLLDQFGVADQARKLPSRLSGGQQQRVAIARALANDPAILVADEPSGNLDSRNSEMIAVTFQQLTDDGRTVIVATHERSGLERYHRILHVSDGAFEADAFESRAA